MRQVICLWAVCAALLQGCQAPDILFSSSHSTVVRFDDYESLWRACRAVLAREFDIVSESERDGRLVAVSRAPTMLATPSTETGYSAPSLTEVTVAIQSRPSGYEVEVRARARATVGPDFGVVRSSGLPRLDKSQDFDPLGSATSRDYALEEQIRSQIQAELSYAPPLTKPIR